MTLRHSNKRFIITVIIQLLLTFFLCIPLIHTNSTLPLAGDYIFHFSRLIGLANSLKDGTYPTGVYSHYFNGFGYGVPLFYADFTILPFALLKAIGLGFSPCIKIMYASIIFATSTTSYLAAQQISKSSYIGICTMIGYCTCQGLFSALYSGWGFGNIMAMMFAPLIIWGTYNLTEHGFSKPWVIILAFAGMVLSHILSTAISILFVTIWVICRINKLIDNPRTIAKLLASALLCLSLTAFFWMPFLEQLKAQDLSYQYIVMSMKNFVPVLSSLYLPRFAYSYGIATFIFFLIIPAVFIWHIRKYGLTTRYKRILKYYSFVLLSIILIFCKPAWVFIAEYSPIDLQTPARLNLFVNFFLFFVIALSFRYFKCLQAYGISLMIFIGASTSCFLSGNLKYVTLNIEQISSNPSLADCGQQAGFGREWIPTRTSIDEIYHHPHEKYLSPNRDLIKGNYLKSGDFSFTFNGEAGTYEVPLLWYKGYQSKLRDNNGKTYDLETSSSQRAFVTVTVDKNMPRGTITTSYQITRIHQIGIAISLTTLLLILLVFIFSKLRFNILHKKLLES